MASSRKPQTTAGPQRVYGYARVSTEKQSTEGVSLEEQQRRIEARCTENGWQLSEVYIDAGVSGSVPLNKRPQGARLLAVVRPGDVIVSSRMDRCFRSAFDALQTIEGFKKRKISLWLLDLGGDVSGNGIAELIATVLAAVAQFERTLISERIQAAKANLRHHNRDQGGLRPFGWRYGEVTGSGKARDLIPDPAEQAAIAEIITLRAAGRTLAQIRDELLGRGFALRSKQSVANILARQGEGVAA